MSARGLSNLLRPFGITPKTIRFPGEELAKGYELVAFEDVFPRYLPSVSVTAVTTNENNNLRNDLSVTETESVTDRDAYKLNKNNNVTDVTDRNGVDGGETPRTALLIPQNSVRCGECHHFIRNHLNPSQGMGKCEVDAPYGPHDPPRYPMARRRCKLFRAKAKPPPGPSPTRAGEVRGVA